MEESRWEDTLQALDSVKAGKFVDVSEVESWLQSRGSSEEPPAEDMNIL